MATFGRSKVRLWESTLEKLGRIFAETYKIHVVFDTDQCMTDGKTIYLPVIPEGASDEFLDAIHGFLDHEVAHHQFTNFDVLAEADKLGLKHHLALNAIEDPRVEREMCKLWRGSKINLANCREWSLKQLSKRWDELSEFGKVLQSIIVKFEVEDKHWFVEKHITPNTDLCSKLEVIKPVTDKLGTIASTQEAFELAKELIKLLEEKEEPPPESDQNNQASQSNMAGIGSPMPSSPKEEQEPTPLVEEPTQQELKKDSEITSTQNQIKKEAQRLQKNYRSRPGRDRYLIYTTENDVIENITTGDKTATAEFLAESRQMVNTIRQKFRLNLLTKTMNRWESGKRRGKIDCHSLHRVTLGTGKDVFRNRVVSQGFDTVASLYIDHSGSMYPNNMDMAAMAALIFGECLNDIGIPFEIVGYSTGEFNEGKEAYLKASKSEQDMYTRWGRLWMGIYKNFDEQWLTSRHRVLNMSRNGKYNTYDGESIRIAAQRLVARREERKILFVFSDGYPCPNVPMFTEIHCAYLKTIALEIEKHIEVFAIGIQSDAVKEYYTNSVVINKLSDLPSVMLSELDRLIRQGQNAYGKAI